MPKQSRTGRPTKLTPSVVTKLVRSFELGANDSEACSSSRISRNTFYRWLQEDQDFSDKIEDAKSYPIFLAKQTMVTAIEKGDVGAAKWYLERRARSEFNLATPEQSTQQPNSIDDSSLEDKVNMIIGEGDVVAEYLKAHEALRETRNGAIVHHSDDTYIE